MFDYSQVQQQSSILNQLKWKLLINLIMAKLLWSCHVY